MLHRSEVVVGRHQIVQNDAIGEFSGEFHHLHPGRTDIYRYVFRPARLVHIVQLDAVEMNVHTVEVDRLVGEEGPYDSHRFPHHGQRLRSLDADFRREWIPPSPDSEDDPTRSEIVERRKGGCQTRCIAGPTVDDSSSHPDAICRCGECGHRYGCVAYQPGIGLPDRLETTLLGVSDIFDGIRERMRVLQIQCQTVHRAFLQRALIKAYRKV